LDLEERLERLERMLDLVIDRLRRIESLLGENSSEARLMNAAIDLVTALSMPASMALEAARRSISTLRSLGGADPISRAIIEALSECRPLTISETARRVRMIRGTSSRRIVRERLLGLEERGAVIKLKTSGHRYKYVLRECVDKNAEEA